MNDINDIGAAMRRARIGAGLTVPALAEKAGIVVSTVRSCEHGRALPGLWTLWHLADALGIGLDELVGRRTPDGPRRVTVTAEVDPELLARMAEWRMECRDGKESN